ncbi:RusA family crossover junction endodeoxyribonuclease [Nocardioides sp. PD653]|uniref:RusA family crossover junction endodeoxyribonuclease n=1 Tax=Nocardioides sp. PD653 TaxID=393303 RepID=UPI0009F1151F|nr:RusA family crossover junction endodeoxyribonuclease [Nocardioides sp. PD653]GAW54704.1 putative Holliday junction resolvase [Nocardioides sp. PD653]
MTTLPGLGGRIAIRVHGTPIPQGSKRIGRHGKRAVILDNNDDVLDPWRKHVKAQAADACRYHDTITGPVRVWLRFAFPRPGSHYRTGRNAALIRDSAPRYPVAKNDLDKLQRAVLDALTDAEVWVDDGLVIDVHARKFYAGEHELAPAKPGVEIILEEVI